MGYVLMLGPEVWAKLPPLPFDSQGVDGQARSAFQRRHRARKPPCQVYCERGDGSSCAGEPGEALEVARLRELGWPGRQVITNDQGREARRLAEIAAGLGRGEAGKPGCFEMGGGAVGG